MQHSEYLEQVIKAHREELLGEAIGNSLVERFGPQWPQRALMQDMAQLEKWTAKVLDPVMDRYALPHPDPADIAREGVEMSQYTESWEGMAAFFREALPPIITVFEEMEAGADDQDKAAMEFLARHERALLTVAQANDEAEQIRAHALIRGLVQEAKDMVGAA